MIGILRWAEPLYNYEGVFWYEITVRRGDLRTHKHRRQDVFKIIELRHKDDENRNINLYTSQEEKGMRARWKEAAQRFDLS